ncbi:hypothetical protein PFISCL1PPCAC_6633, partial [Pristionchus fissidentatus]
FLFLLPTRLFSTSGVIAFVVLGVCLLVCVGICVWVCIKRTNTDGPMPGLPMDYPRQRFINSPMPAY